MAEENKNIVSLDNDKVVKDPVPVFKAQQDKFYRIYIPDVSNIFRYSQHFDENAKFARCLSDKDEPCPICNLGNVPVLKFKTNIFLYNTTTDDGNLPEDLNYVSLTPQIFRFGSKIWTALRTKHKKFAKQGGLTTIDLILKCTNGQFQHFDIEDDITCAIKESERLQKLAEKAKARFIDFTSEDNLDARFLTPPQMKVYLAKLTGTAVVLTPKEELDAIEKELHVNKDKADISDFSEGVEENLEDLV